MSELGGTVGVGELESATEGTCAHVIRLDGDVRLEVVVVDGWLKGIGRVWCGSTLLRSGRECIWPQISTPEGEEIDGYRLLGIEEEQGVWILRTRPCFRVAHRMDWTEHALHPRISTRSWTEAPEPAETGLLEWRIAPERLSLDGTDYRGFSYAFTYHCPGRSIYQIEDKATWELGGDAAGNTFVMRGAFAHPVARLGEAEYDSGWTLPGIVNPYIFQHVPLYAQLQGFTFQYDQRHVLLTVHERPSHVRSLFHKDADSPLLLHFNQFCFDLADKVTTPARRILVGARSGSACGMANHYLRVRETLQEQVRAYYGIRHQLPEPSTHVETWSIANVAQFAPVFQQMKQWGLRRAFIMPLWRSNETDIKPRFSADSERFGELGNMCCPLEFEIADCYGGWEGFKRIMSSASECDVETYMWISPHLSSVSPLRNKIPGLFATDVSGQCNRNNYGHVLLVCNQNNEQFQAYFLGAVSRLKQCGMAGVFRDSHFNMAADTIHFAHVGEPANDRGPADAKPEIRAVIRTQHDTEVAIQRRIQVELGMLYYVESSGLFGTPMVGTRYPWVRGCEYIWSDMESQMDANLVRREGDSCEMAFFRGLSVRLFYQVGIEVNNFPQPGSVESWWNPSTMGPMVQAYHRVRALMKRMTLLENDCGVRWTDGAQDVIFCYRDHRYQTDGRSVLDVLAGRQLTGDEVELRPMGIYLAGGPTQQIAQKTFDS